MKFTVSTTPLKNVISLGVIKANISKFFYTSNLIQITANKDTLRLNHVSNGIKTQMTLRGSGDEDSETTILVDCSVFKSLIDTIESDTVTLEYSDGGLFIVAGTSRFTLSKMVDAEGMNIDAPADSYNSSEVKDITPSVWKFIKDHMAFAMSTSNQYLVYRNLWVSENDDVLAGDYSQSLFAYSKQPTLGNTCLLPASLLNLFVALPENSRVAKAGDNYVLQIETDSYTLLTEFTPKYESDEKVGSYNAPVIMGMLNHPEHSAKLEIAPVLKFLNQSALLTSNSLDKVVILKSDEESLTFTTRQSELCLPVSESAPYQVKFNSDLLKSVLSNFDSDEISIAPIIRDGVAIGCIFWSDTITMLLAGTTA